MAHRPHRAAQRPPRQPRSGSRQVNGRDGEVSRATLTAISNSKRGSGEARRGRADRDPVDPLGQAGRERRRSTWARAATSTSSGACATTTTTTRAAQTVFGFSFTCEEIDYLDSRAESEAQEGASRPPASTAGSRSPAAARPTATRRAVLNDGRAPL